MRWAVRRSRRSTKAPRNNNPTRASTSGYRTEMGAPHARHSPRSEIQLTIGTLSREAIDPKQIGHREPGQITLFCHGIR